MFRFEPGQRFADRYTIVEEIGAGGQAHVFKAIDVQSRRTVALKLMSPSLGGDSLRVERFKRELTLAQRVSHTNVCRVHDIGESDRFYYISMEYIDGQTLKDWAQAVGHLSPRQTVSVGSQICAGLEAIHAEAIIHRDLKPHNIMLDRSGRIVVMDFGLAYPLDAEPITAAGAALGTLAYMSPEQTVGEKADIRSDIYALGVILYEMLTGRRPPGDGENLPLALRRTGERCPVPSEWTPGVPEALDVVVIRCLEREPSRRPQSAAEVGARLLEAEAMLSTSSIGAQTPRADRTWKFATLAVIVLSAVIVAFLILRLPPAPTEITRLAVQQLEYEGPPESEYIRDLAPVLLEKALRSYDRLQVTPYDSSRSFAATEEPALMAEQLGVDMLLQGEVLVHGEDLDARFRAFSAAGEKSWERRFSGTTTEVVAILDDVTTAFANTVGAQSAVLEPPPSARTLQLYLKGMAYLEGWDVERNHELAEQALRQTIEEDDRFAEAHAGLSRALWKQYEETRRPALVREALAAAERAAAERAAELNPDLPQAHLASGIVQLGQGRTAESLASFALAQQLAPGDDAVCRRIAGAYANLGRDGEAESMYQRAIDLRPRYWENYNYKGVFYLDSGRLEEAKIMFRNVVELRPESDTGYVNLAIAHSFLGELDQAEPLLRAALRIHPSAHAHSSLGFVYYSQKQYQEAAFEFENATELILDDALYFSNLGDAYRQLGRAEDAREAYVRSIELGEARLRVNALDREASAELSMALAGAGRCEESREQADYSTAGEPVSPATVIAASGCAFDLGLPSGAR